MNNHAPDSAVSMKPAPASESTIGRDWVERVLPFASVTILFTLLSVSSPYFLTVQNRYTGEREHPRSEEHTSELQSLRHLVCRLLLEKKKASRTLMHLQD